MRFTLTLDLDNDAYQPDPRHGILDALKEAAYQVCSTRAGRRPDWEGTILDPNGNTVGHWAIVEDTPSCDCETGGKAC